jgi:mono/diheme cytochrome c family protein
MIARGKTILPILMSVIATAGCQSPAEAPSGPEQVYRDACLVCHAGSGPGASAPDLTTLSAVNGGSFPMEEVIAIIDGRQDVRAHGSSMPVWGTRHSTEELQALAAYLATIQQ